jgi:hypothetical protein
LKGVGAKGRIASGGRLTHGQKTLKLYRRDWVRFLGSYSLLYDEHGVGLSVHAVELLGRIFRRLVVALPRLGFKLSSIKIIVFDMAPQRRDLGGIIIKLPPPSVQTMLVMCYLICLVFSPNFFFLAKRQITDDEEKHCIYEK